MENCFEVWIKKKIHLAECLEKGKYDSDYSDAVIFLCVIINAIASNLWKGENNDKRKFIELLVNHSNKYPKIDFISLPLIYQCQKKKGKEECIILLEKKFPKLTKWHSEIMNSSEIDYPVDSLTDIGLTPKEIREYSYANIIYKKLRCGLVHEYNPKEFVTAKPSTTLYVDISYSNEEPFHKIHFHFKWLIELVNAVVENTKNDIDKYIQLPTPTSWWIDGN